MKTTKKRADQIQAGDRIPFVCEFGSIVDTVKEVALHGSFATIRFERDEYGIQPLAQVKLISDLVRVLVENKP
jgi:hypothetical protein